MTGRIFKVGLDGNITAANVIRDEMDKPVRSMADGKVYTSKSALRRSYKASGNPQGVTYTEVGDDPARLRQPEKPKADEKGIKDAVDRTLARISRGER
jgi:hypothetical protein